MGWREAGAARDFPEGRLCRVEIQGRGLLIVRRGERVFALRDICPHQGGPLSAGRLTGRVLPCLPGQEIRLERPGEILVCPWHGWEFDLLTGCSLTQPERVRVRAYPARLEDGRVLVDMD